MVRESWTDNPKKDAGPSVEHLEQQTVRALSSDGPRATSVARTVRDVQEVGPPNTSRQKTTGQPDRKENTQEHATNTKNTWTNFISRTVHQQPADGPPGTGTAART
jgi:hypothetical protein